MRDGRAEAFQEVLVDLNIFHPSVMTGNTFSCGEMILPIWL